MIHLPIPMTLGVLVKRREHDGKDRLHIVTDQVAKIFIVPEVQCAFGNLEK
jgi:hypothetical protein